MANRVYLVAAGADPAAPIDDGRILAASKEVVPVFWFALFGESDRATRGSGEPTLHVERSAGLARARARRRALLSRLPARCAPFFDQLLALVDGAGSSHLQVALGDLVAALGANEVDQQLEASLRALESGDDDDLTVLFDRQSLDLESGLDAVEVRGSGAEVGADLRGLEWARPVPWSATDEEAFDQAWAAGPAWEVVFVRAGAPVSIGGRSFAPAAGSGWAAIPAAQLGRRREGLEAHEVVELSCDRDGPRFSYRHTRRGALQRAAGYAGRWSCAGPRSEAWEAVVFADPARLERSLEALEAGAKGAPGLRAMADEQAAKVRKAFASQRLSAGLGELPALDEELLRAIVDAIARQLELPIPRPG